MTQPSTGTSMQVIIIIIIKLWFTYLGHMFKDAIILIIIYVVSIIPDMSLIITTVCLCILNLNVSIFILNSFVK